MKTKNVLTRILLSALIMVPFIFACSSDDDDDNPAIAITLSADATSVVEGIPVTFTVTDDSGNDVTANATLSANGETISNPHTFNNEGVYNVVATLNSSTSNTLSITVNPGGQATSITLTTASTGDLYAETPITFTVMDDQGNDVTGGSTLKVDGTSVNNPHTFPSAGDYTVEAKYGTLTTQLTVTILAAPSYGITHSFSATGAPASFTKKVLIEDFTGTWCQFCPQAAAAVEEALEKGDKVLAAGHHVGSTDPMEIYATKIMKSHYELPGLPFVFVGGSDYKWDTGMTLESMLTQVDSELAEETPLGLALKTQIIGGKLEIEVKVGYKTAITEEIRIEVYLVEDNVKVNVAQAGSDLGKDYIHRYVTRAVYTYEPDGNKFGNVIPASSTGVGGVYTQTISGLEIPSTIVNSDNLRVIAFARNSYNKTWTDSAGGVHTDAPQYDIYNVQYVDGLGTSQDFD